MVDYKLISSKIELSIIEHQETGTIWDFVKTQNITHSRPNSDNTITFHSKGITQICNNNYEYNFQRTFSIAFNNQKEYDDFVQKILIPFDELIFKGHGENSQAQFLD